MSTYQVTARREGNYWTLDVPDVGATQSRNLRDAPGMVSEYVGILAADSEASVVITVVDERAARARSAQDRLAQATAAQAEASREMRAAVNDLRSAGITVADVSAMLNISTQRVSQLAGSVTDRTPSSATLSATPDDPESAATAIQVEAPKTAPVAVRV